MRFSRLLWIVALTFIHHGAYAADILIWDFKVVIQTDAQFSVTCIDSASLHPANDNRGGRVFTTGNCTGSFNPLMNDPQASVKSVPGSGFVQLYVKIPGLTPSLQYCVAEYTSSVSVGDDGQVYNVSDALLSPVSPSCTVQSVQMSARGRHWSGCNWQHYEGGDVQIVHRNWYNYASEELYQSEPGYVISSLDRISVTGGAGRTWRDTVNNLAKKSLQGPVNFALSDCGGGVLERLEVWVGSLDFSIFGASSSDTRSSVASTLTVKTPTGQVQVPYSSASAFSVNVTRSGSAVTTTTAVTAGGVTETGNNGTVTNIGAGGTHSTMTLATATRDFNGDSKSDLLWRDSSGIAAIWTLNGSSVSQTASLGSVPSNWSIVAQRDFTSDGKYDILWRNTTDGTLAVWQMNGAALSQGISLGVIATSWQIVGTNNFNADQSSDILWRDSSGTLALWLMNGVSISQTAALGTIPTSWQIAATADFNGDSKADILWRDTSTGTTAIWFMDGLQIASTASIGTVPSDWQIASTGDFDGDGKADILWRQSTGTVAIWLMNGAQTVGTTALGVIPSSWTIVGTGDFNGDGKSDILWRDSSGIVAIWFLNGLQLSSSASLGTVPTSWVIQTANAN